MLHIKINMEERTKKAELDKDQNFINDIITQLRKFLIVSLSLIILSYCSRFRFFMKSFLSLPDPTKLHVVSRAAEVNPFSYRINKISPDVISQPEGANQNPTFESIRKKCWDECAGGTLIIENSAHGGNERSVNTLMYVAFHFILITFLLGERL